MAHSPGQKEASRAKILASAGRGFRSRGFGGLGVDALAAEAGVTSGAFYTHFKSKADAFRYAVVAGLKDLKSCVEQFKEQFGSRWTQDFIDFYMNDRRTCSLAESCALQSLSSDVARADEVTRQLFEKEFELVIEAVTAGLTGKSSAKRENAIVLMALLSGGVTLARAVNDPVLSDEIANSIRKVAASLAK